MNRKINIDKCLLEIRELPLEVSFEQVEHWVRNYKATKFKPASKNQRSWRTLFNKWWNP